jgi:hypothetical protein
MSYYIYCHIGTAELPGYLVDSISSVLKNDTNSKVFLVTDQYFLIQGVTILQVDQIISKQSWLVMKMPLHRRQENPLWRRSIFRIFLIRDAMKHLRIPYFYHFDSDVLLFVPSSEFEATLQDFDGLYITPCNSNEYVFGFSRFGSLSKTNAICSILFKLVFNPFLRRKYYVNMPNEMELLAGIAKRNPDLIRPLTTLPTSKEIEFVFDPSSYGQYFGGTHQGHLPGWASKDHDIGEQILNSTMVPLMIQNRPFVKKDGKIYKIINLHIHSKKTSQFF